MTLFSEVRTAGPDLSLSRPCASTAYALALVSRPCASQPPGSLPLNMLQSWTVAN
eukprot:CAMPEP_0174367908 /NCGR_PEP_ID=MMETSP0811_2-20130205/87077_1 /TAXON_ID=73025 ORGANISM="Eutreptiella gymnastica-like, Strain CCMP1594" /NCGR_SAMPLE_ID=MMETSP0811_2 /ASSEMBLY_ACC=CAM_ASM_000667 /LENGTH=54 /DNA_ID=CAMNT_0015510913 /DNA_START=1445 /DNA_END=1609 /DNA_ORIENTATION=-